MKQLVAQAMQQGALGLSTSLQYVPDRFASTDEIVELAKVAARYGGVYFTHQRSESARIFESLDEVFAVAERANIPAGDLAPENRLQGQLRQDAGGAAAHRGGAGARPRRHREPVSLHARVERPRLLPAALGARRRLRQDAAAPHRSGDARADQEGHGRSERRDLGEPVVRRQRRRRRDAVVGAEPRSGEVRGHDDDADRQGDGEGSARRGHRSGDRRSRRELGDHLDHGRRRCADGAEASAGRRRHRFGRAGGGRPALGIEVAPARVGIVSAHPRPLRARRAPADARRGDPQDDVEGGRSRPPERSRRCCGRA